MQNLIVKLLGVAIACVSLGLYLHGSMALAYTITMLLCSFMVFESLDVARALNISKPSVSRAIRLLQDGGFLLMHEDKSLALTEAGQEVAQAVYEKHRVIKDGLISLGVSPDVAEQDACGIEHVISRESFEALRSLWAHRLLTSSGSPA